MRITTAEIPPEWKDEIEGIAQATGRTSGDVVREALAQYLSETDPVTHRLVHLETAITVIYMPLMAGGRSQIKNWINDFYYNFPSVSETIQQLLELLNLYTKFYSPFVLEIQPFAESIDLEFILEDFPKLLSSLKSTPERFHQIDQYYQSQGMFSSFCLMNCKRKLQTF